MYVIVNEAWSSYDRLIFGPYEKYFDAKEALIRLKLEEGPEDIWSIEPIAGA